MFTGDLPCYYEKLLQSEIKESDNMTTPNANELPLWFLDMSYVQLFDWPGRNCGLEEVVCLKNNGKIDISALLAIGDMVA